MTAPTIKVAEFTNSLLEHAVVRGLPLRDGFADLTRAETRYYNYFGLHGMRFDRSMAKAQLCQDFWVVYLLDLLGGVDEVPNFFVEFGAYDGTTLSNTFLLEKVFNWHGILAEPSPGPCDACRKCRNCTVDSRCVWHTTGEIVAFNEVPGNAELATVTAYEAGDMHAAKRAETKRLVQASTVSLNDLLAEHRAPKTIGYMSIDTEGSEYDILRSFDFRLHRILVLSVEHNFTNMQSKLEALLGEANMVKVPRSVRLFDDMYVHNDIATRLQ